MGAAFGKVKRLKTSALEIPRCCRENKQEKHSCALSTGNVSVVFPQVCAAVVGQVRCSRARLAGWHCYPTPNCPSPGISGGSLGNSEAEPVQLQEAETQQSFHPHKMPVAVLAQHWEGAGCLDVGVIF